MQGFYDDWRADLLTGPYWIHTPNNFLNLCTNNCDFCRKKNLVAEMLNTVLKCNHAQEFEAGFDPSEKWLALKITNNSYIQKNCKNIHVFQQIPHNINSG